MTTWQAIMAILRRWPIAVVGIVATLVAVVVLIGRPGVYETSAEMYLIPPPNTVSTPIGGQNRGMIAMAGLLERQINASNAAKPVSADVTLADMGIRDGELLQLPNSGGQWDYNFTQPLLKISTTAAGARTAAAKRDALRDQVVDTLAALQAEDGVAPARRITTRQVPTDPPVLFRDGRPEVAAAVLVILGLGLTATGCVVIDLWLSAPRRTRSRPLIDA